MSRWAFVAEDGTVLSILTGSAADWPDLRALDRVKPAPNSNVLPGSRWNGALFMPPVPSGGPRTISPLEFRRRFTQAECVAITTAAAGNATLAIWMDDLSAAADVNLDGTEVAAGLAMLVGATLLTANRAAELVK